MTPAETKAITPPRPTGRPATRRPTFAFSSEAGASFRWSAPSKPGTPSFAACSGAGRHPHTGGRPRRRRPHLPCPRLGPAGRPGRLARHPGLHRRRGRTGHGDRLRPVGPDQRHDPFVRVPLDRGRIELPVLGGHREPRPGAPAPVRTSRRRSSHPPREPGRSAPAPPTGLATRTRPRRPAGFTVDTTAPETAIEQRQPSRCATNDDTPTFGFSSRGRGELRVFGRLGDDHLPLQPVHQEHPHDRGAERKGRPHLSGSAPPRRRGQCRCLIFTPPAGGSSSRHRQSSGAP